MPKSRVNEYKTGAADTRPWGSWRVIASREGYIVKEIVVNPGEVLSLQSHQHRSEHWIVMQGIAEITIDDQVFVRREKETAFIPMKAKHRIANIGTEPMIFVEVQVGDVLTESDITRYEDRYGRQN